MNEAVHCLIDEVRPDPVRAVSLLEDHARRGEPAAWGWLANLAAAGVGMPRDFERALDLLLQGALLGMPESIGQLSALAADHAVTRSRDLASGDRAAWIDLRRSIQIDEWLAPCDKLVLRESPRSVAIERFLTPAVCGWLISRSSGRLERARTYGNRGDGPLVTSARSNTAFEFAFTDCDVLTHLTRARIAATIGVPIGALEPVQVLHYEAGEEFALHHDYLDFADPGHAADIAKRGQRIVTFLVYLNDDYVGGETDFPALALRHKGKTGDALYFGNLKPDGSPDARTLHAGSPPTAGEKWLLSQWIRNRAQV